MSTDHRVQEQIEQLGPWFHNIHLPDGSQTAPDHFLGDFPGYLWEKIDMVIPPDLSGLSVLDVGCNAGFYSLKLAQRGAEVTAIDLDPRYLRQAEWVIDRFNLSNRITLRQRQVYDLAGDKMQYDIIWFMGVFYHLRYPLLALDILSKKVRNFMMFQTLTMPGEESYHAEDDYAIHDRRQMLDEGWPKMAFIEHRFSGDPTNWWFANRSCIEAMLRSCGLKITRRPDDELYLCEPDAGNSAVTETWNESEYLSAIQSEWKDTWRKKVR